MATYARCGWIFSNKFTANLPGNLPVKKNRKSVEIWQNYGHAFVVSLYTERKCADTIGTVLVPGLTISNAKI